MFGTVGSRAGRSVRGELDGVARITNRNGKIGSSLNFWGDSANIHRLQDRVFVGAAAAVNSGTAPEAPKDWLETLVSATTQNAQFVSINTLGMIGVIGASRSSDFPGVSASIGGAFYAQNNQTAFNTQAWGLYSEAHRESGGYNTFGFETDVMNNGTVVDVSPSAMFPSGITAAVWLGSGASGGSAAASVAIGVLDNGQKFRKGIVFKSTALDTSLGGGGAGVALEMFAGQSLRWLNGGGATVSEIYGNGAGLNIVNGNLNISSSGSFLPQTQSFNFANDSSASYIIYYKNRAGAAVQVGDNLGTFQFQGYNTSLAYSQAATLTSTVESVGSGSVAASLSVAAGSSIFSFHPAGELQFPSVTLGAAVGGGIDYDGKAFYASAISATRQVINAEQISVLTTDFTGTNVATAQPVFSATQDVLTVAASTTYEFEFEYEIDTTGTTSHSLALLFGGTATFTSIAYSALVTNGAASGTASAPLLSRAAAATAQTVTAAVAAATQNTVRGRGTARINGAGTVIPQFQYSAAPGAAPTVKANSFFRLWAIGSDTVAVVGAFA